MHNISRAVSLAVLVLAVSLNPVGLQGVGAQEAETDVDDVRSALIPTKPVPGKPWLVWDEQVFDYGVWVTGGPPIDGEFTFRNVGDADLRITAVKPDCGCTATHYDEVVPPGGRGRVGFEMDIGELGADGSGRTTIRVLTDSPGHPMTVLTIEGKIVDPIEVRPSPYVSFNFVSQDRPSTMTLEVVSHVEGSFKIVNIASDNPCFKASAAPVEPGRRYRLTVVARPPFRPGPNQGTIRLATSLDAHPEVVVPVSAVLPLRVSVHPKVIRVRPEDSRAREHKVQLHSRGSPRVKIIKARVSDPRIRVEVIRPARNDPPYVRVVIPPRYEAARTGIALLTIETNDKEFKEFRIRIGTTRSLMQSDGLKMRGSPSGSDAPGRPGAGLNPGAPLPTNDFVGPPVPSRLAPAADRPADSK